MKRKLIITSSIALLIITGVAIWLAQRGSVVDPNIQPQPAGMGDNSGQSRSSLNQWQSGQSLGKSPSAARFLRPETVKGMKDLEVDMSEVLKAATDDATGKRSPWFELLKKWHQLLGKAAQSGKREDLFALVPIAASFYARDREAEPLAEPFDDLKYGMGALGYDLVTELGKAVAENHGVLDERIGSIAVTIFAVKGIRSDPWPEDETPPIDSAGVLIARPEVMQLLEKLPPEQLDFFLRARSADMFFRRYEPNGNGMPVLCERYSKNRDALRQAFEKLLDKAHANNDERNRARGAGGVSLPP